MIPPRRTIAIDAISSVLGGGITVMACLTNELVRLAPRWRFHIFLTASELAEQLDPAANLELHYGKYCGSGWGRLLRQQLALPIQVSRLGVDAMISQFPGVMLCPVPQVMMVLNSFYLHEPPIASSRRQAMKVRVQRFMFEVGFRRVQCAAYSSHEMAGIARRWTGPSPGKTVIAYEAVRPTFWRYAAQTDEARPGVPPYFMAVGTIATHKNYETMLRGFADFCGQWRGPARLKIAGSFEALDAYRAGGGSKPGLIGLAEELGIADRVDWLGSVNADGLCGLLARATAFVITSKLEAFPLTAMEAITVGCPVLVPRNTSFPEIIGDAGLYHPTMDAQALADNMLRVVQDADLRQRLVKAGTERVRNCTWERTAGQYLHILAAISDGGHCACGLL
ncbi:MAG: glycosyltransferase family 1 protein [Phycisphaerae bacterium]|nr:glycosyltransferase family 1 protein [Phycisphaerae bacterium]